MTPESLQGNLIVNFPHFDIHYSDDESDFYVYSGYVKPGTHTILVYDPITDQLMKKENIFVMPREDDLLHTKQQSINYD